jgi:membrane-bound lytic murein transglycosylase B|tara:strand:- start:12588 stop:13613 length:1026 start_codon:yes stop_codon:yes gene_type:complete
MNGTNLTRRSKTFLLICLLIINPSSLGSEQFPFVEWLEGVEEEALTRGISQPTIDAALMGLERDERVIGFDRHQPEFVQTFDEYLTARVSRTRVEEGIRLMAEHKGTLDRIGDHYGVDPRYLISFWGLESSFGKHQGTYQVIRSLATLAYDPRRSAFFRSELFNALQILDEGHIDPDRMLGGWAGAMGQNQFLPSSFLNYAQDFAGDGHKDIWNDPVDVWASIANYLRVNGWRRGQGWGMKVQLPAGFEFADLKQDKIPRGCRALRQHTRKMALATWQQMGIRDETGADLPTADFTAALIVPESPREFTYLVFPNFRAILSYNCANKYAVSVGMMVDSITP